MGAASAASPVGTDRRSRWARPAGCLALGLSLAVASLSAAARPERIVSVDTATDTLVLQIADREQIVAVRHRTRKPQNSMAWALARQVAGLGRDQAEAVYRLEPDMVFFGRWGGRSTREMLERLGTPVQRLSSPQNWDEVYTNIHQVGEVTGHPARAEAMIAEIQARLAGIAAALAGAAPKRAVMYLGRGHTYGRGSRQHFLMESAGLINLSAERGIRGLGRLDIEELILSEPDVLIFSDYYKDTPTLSRQILDHPAFARLAGHVTVVELPSNRMNATCAYLVDGVEILARAAFPERFPAAWAAEAPPPEERSE